MYCTDWKKFFDTINGKTKHVPKSFVSPPAPKFPKFKPQGK